MEKNTFKAAAVAGGSLEETKLGVWRVLTEKDDQTSLGFAMRWKKMAAILPTIQKFVADVYMLGPGLLTLIVLSKLWSGVEHVLLLHFANRVLSIIEVSLREGQPDTAAIVNAVIARFLVVAISAAVEWWRTQATPIMQNRCIHHYEDLLFSSNLQADLPTIHDNNADISLSAEPIWYHFTNILDVAQTGIETASLLTYIFQIAISSRHGPVFVLLCLGKPFIGFFARRSLWDKAHVAQATDPQYLRLRALKELGETKYRQDIISMNITNYILGEYERAREELGDTEMGAPWKIYENQHSLGLTVLTELAGDLTMLYYAGNAVFNPEKFTLTSIAMLQHSESILQRTFSDGVRQIGELRRSMGFMQRIYGVTNIVNVIKDGSLEYPGMDQSQTAGMSIDLRNVSFSYPGSTSNAKALDDVSFSIKSGQLVVLVGANGSGKSSLVKLLARLYDTSSGKVLVNGHDIRNYRIKDIRGATASLTQDHHLYPLSFAENIGLGNPNQSSDVDMIVDAARKGGANNFVSKLKEGFSTVLDQKKHQYTTHVKDLDKKTPLSQEADKLSKTIDISGGEKQRVVASRTFMRFTSGTVKLVIADEGSSALDPEGEWELFKNLREARQGKTMVFVTHRFGHLTKYADLILCMKGGRLIESGSHEDLMKIPDGEYSKLYDMQAKAFATVD
ncbi:P-loop containing nucleoside triphosphate hydrolase protein [Mycena albidolilacea]|uniref:P-loop containing nucleoside triphosphate hydrolase protein n=1 Tax=Mycena albidolilacea TaxID=1033008 RepID=A0AAD7AS96_9AGAR|nr:P-loop containing nucleoside triphosphate hydrolase protein [Mycena albidolilacea]